jgi:hypothetical protein
MTIKIIVPTMSTETVDEIHYRCPVCNAETRLTVERPGPAGHV